MTTESTRLQHGATPRNLRGASTNPSNSDNLPTHCCCCFWWFSVIEGCFLSRMCNSLINFDCKTQRYRCGHSQQRLLSRVEPNRGVESGELLQRKYSGFREEGPERHSRYMRNRLLQRLALLAALFMVRLGGLGGVVAQKKDELGFEVRTYNGTNNNLDNPLWGSVNITQVKTTITMI